MAIQMRAKIAQLEADLRGTNATIDKKCKDFDLLQAQQHRANNEIERLLIQNGLLVSSMADLSKALLRSTRG